MEGVGDIYWEDSGDLVDVDEKRVFLKHHPKQRIHLYIRPDTPGWSTFRSNPSLHTLSKALFFSFLVNRDYCCLFPQSSSSLP